MANYCKKSSLDSIAAAIRGRSGKNNLLSFPNDFKDEIDALEIVQSKGSPSETLDATTKIYTIQKGRYTGGSVSVIPDTSQELTPSSSSQSISGQNGKTLAKVKVKAVPLYKIAEGLLQPSSSRTSWSLTGLSFQPEGAIMVALGSVDLLKTYGIAGITNDLHGTSGYGYARSYSSSGAPGAVVSSPISLGTDSVSITNPQVTDPSKGTQAGLLSDPYYYCVWGR